MYRMVGFSFGIVSTFQKDADITAAVAASHVMLQESDTALSSGCKSSGT